jgi:hypothetical protein
MREYNHRERLEITLLAEECSRSGNEQPLIDYINKLHTTKWENGKTITNSIIDNYFPDCHDRFRDKLLNILQEFGKKLVESQIDIPVEFKEIVDEHFWDLVDPGHDTGPDLSNDSSPMNTFGNDNYGK